MDKTLPQDPTREEKVSNCALPHKLCSIDLKAPVTILVEKSPVVGPPIPEISVKTQTMCTKI